MTTPDDIVRLLAQANAHEARAGSYYQRAREAHADDDRDYCFEREREEADAARSLRATAWGLVQANPALKPAGIEVPEPLLRNPRR